MTLRPTQYSDPETASLLRASQESDARNEIKPYLRSKALTVLLTAGVAKVQHGLKRKPSGWLLHSVLGSADAHVATAPDASIITVTSSVAGSCILEVW